MNEEKEYWYIGIGLCIMCFLLLCINGVTKGDMQALREECRLNATYYEERIEAYQSTVALISHDFESCYNSFNALLDNCEPIPFELGEVYYDNRINRFVHIREKTDTGYLVGVAKGYSDCQTIISSIPMNDEYMLFELEQIDNIGDYADYNEIGWFVR